MLRISSLLALVLALLVGCGGGGARGVQWPKSADTVEVERWQDDGGESISPKGSATALGSREAATPATAATGDKSLERELVDLITASGPSGAATSDETKQILDLLEGIELEETIVIEVED